MLHRIKAIIEDNTTRRGRIFDVTMMGIILFALACYAVETLPGLSQTSLEILYYLEWITIVIFTVEYAFRWTVADNKWKFVRSWYGLIDLLAIVPFYISLLLTTGVDLRYVRVFRMFRLFRAFKLVRYSKAIRLFARAFVIAKEELVLFFIVTLMLLYLSAALIYNFENAVQPEYYSSIFSSLWWAVVTLTTVGYGDVVPISVGGRFFTFCLLIVGLGIIAVPSGIVASALSKAREQQYNETLERSKAETGRGPEP